MNDFDNKMWKMRVLLCIAEVAGRSQYTFGGIAGSLTAEARLGEVLTPLNVNDVLLTVQSNSSEIGGTIGRNGSTELYVTTKNMEIEAIGDDLKIGGMIGQNTANMGMDTTELLALGSTLSASGSNAHVGGIAGDNSGTLLSGTAQDGTITVTGELNAAGGIVGRNTGTLLHLNAVNMTIQAQADSAMVGGIVGLSERAIVDGDDPRIENVRVDQQWTPLILATHPQVYAGGIVGYGLDTQILMPVVTALLPESVLMTAAEHAARMGGIAGMMVNGSVISDGILTNVENLILVLGENSEGSFAGGIVGYNDKTLLDQLVLKTGIITLRGEDGIAGGAVGFNLSTETAMISNVYLEGVNLRAMPSAARAIIGGVVGAHESGSIRNSYAGKNVAAQGISHGYVSNRWYRRSLQKP